MIASYKGHVEVVKYLLLKGANPNVAGKRCIGSNSREERTTALLPANCGATALHFASECGHVDIVRALFDSGAVMSLNEHGMTPLMAAAERCQEEVVDYITKRHDVSKEERITAFELLGASFANDKEHYDITKTFSYLMRSMRERWSQPDRVIFKAEAAPVAAYDMWIERRTVDELLEIEADAHALHMESLCIRERVLGVTNPEVPHPVIFRGAVFADNARFDRCIALWLHALRLKQNAHVCNTKDLLRFAQVFSQMDHIGVDITFSHMEEVLRACVGEVKSKLEKVANPGPKDDVDCLREELENNMHTFLYLLVVFSKMKKSLCSEDVFPAMRQVYEMLTLDPRRRDGASLLHLAVNPETPGNFIHKKKRNIQESNQSFSSFS
jgi:Fem-1 family protein b